MPCTSKGFGQYAAGEGHVGVYPRLRPTIQRRGVIVTHGHGADHTSPVFGPYGVPPGVPAALADAGMPVLSIDAGGTQPWGNDTSIARVADGWSYIKSQFGAKSDQVLIYGASMGALIALNWAKANPGLVAAMALHLPVTDLADIHDNNRIGYAVEIETAFGGAAGYAAAIAAHNPIANASAFSDIPIKMWYASNDTVVMPATVDAFASATGAKKASLGAVGHTTNTLDPGEVLAFLRPYAQ